jgi:hypothetical protein
MVNAKGWPNTEAPRKRPKVMAAVGCDSTKPARAQQTKV